MHLLKVAKINLVNVQTIQTPLYVYIPYLDEQCWGADDGVKGWYIMDVPDDGELAVPCVILRFLQHRGF